MNVNAVDRSVHWAKAVFGGAILVAILGMLVILAGVFDPPLPRCELPFEPVALTAVAHDQVVWFDALPNGTTGARLTATWREGELDAGYGVLLGTPDNHIGVAVAPIGYVTVWQSAENETQTLMPWQPWVHVNRDALPNEFWFEWRGEELTARLNREIVWQMPLNGVMEQENRLAGWATTFGEPVTVSLAEQFSVGDCAD